MKRALFAIALSLFVSCQQAEHPTLCVLDARAYDASAQVCSQPLTRAEEGLTIYVLHTLPSKVDPPGPVRLRVESACDSEEREVAYAPLPGNDQHVAVASFKTPKGAGCGLIVTATVADQTQRQVIVGSCTTSCGGDAAVSDVGDDAGESASDSDASDDGSAVADDAGEDG
jgi:hypothetical protein